MAFTANLIIPLSYRQATKSMGTRKKTGKDKEYKNNININLKMFSLHCAYLNLVVLSNNANIVKRNIFSYQKKNHHPLLIAV